MTNLIAKYAQLDFKVLPRGTENLTARHQLAIGSTTSLLLLNMYDARKT